MKAIELKKAFDPKDFEQRIYDFWQKNDYFKPRKPKSKDDETFVIVIPPPNVTGVLHMGHGLNNCLQDILIRYHRMQGKATLWVPGTDHAGIATQNVVDRKLRARGIEKEKIGREKFIEETWKVKEEHHTHIIKQLQKMGSSCDWSRERFTLDEGLSQAVREVFVTLYERDLLYKGHYLVNWCCSCGTALSDDEVEHEEIQGKMYHIRYPYTDKSGFIQIATTRPETLLGDTAVAVHPKDKRYKQTVGKLLSLPLTDREIPIIADSYVDREYGTGMVKITPAHDSNDYEVGKRHNLEEVNILEPNGTLGTNVPEKYRGMTVKDARKAVVADLEAADLLVKIEEHPHQVGHCYRCHSAIEPYLSEQWFVRMKPLADKALAAWQKGELVFYPKRWENTYSHWLNNIRDWCISRQLWWGHRIPAWYCDDCGEMAVSRTDLTECPKCGSTNIRQDEDVLDTWFSSWLWPFSTLGWPEKTTDLEDYFPTTALVTAYDIIFFWVARMIMASLEFMGRVPFKDIFITGLVRDIKGRKMSKSLGNGIDPLEVVDEYGADALKFTFAFLAAQGQDLPMEKDTFKIGSKFANKIWNAARYILMNLEGRTLLAREEITLNEVDKWVLHRLGEAAWTAAKGIDGYRFNEGAQAVYEFFWNDFCDWYIESTKLTLYSDDEAEKDRTVSMLILVLEEALRLLHPFLPFITEEIYQKLPVREEALINAPYPVQSPERSFPETAANYASLQELTRLVRTLRSEFTIPPERKVRLHVKTESGFQAAGFFEDHSDLIGMLVSTSELTFSGDAPGDEGSVKVIGNGFEGFVFVKDVIDVPKEIEKLKKNIGKAEKQIQQTEKKLSNSTFLDKAPAEVVEKEKQKQDELSRKIGKMKAYVEELEE
jgi:valyl-tRNA synthetase